LIGFCFAKIARAAGILARLGNSSEVGIRAQQTSVSAAVRTYYATKGCSALDLKLATYEQTPTVHNRGHRRHGIHCFLPATGNHRNLHRGASGSSQSYGDAIAEA